MPWCVDGPLLKVSGIEGTTQRLDICLWIQDDMWLKELKRLVEAKCATVSHDWHKFMNARALDGWDLIFPSPVLPFPSRTCRVAILVIVHKRTLHVYYS
jgi:hypothetical protein